MDRFSIHRPVLGAVSNSQDEFFCSVQNECWFVRVYILDLLLRSPISPLSPRQEAPRTSFRREMDEEEASCPGMDAPRF